MPALPWQVRSIEHTLAAEAVDNHTSYWPKQEHGQNLVEDQSRHGESSSCHLEDQHDNRNVVQSVAKGG
jgi:hypothetical protein